MVLDLAEYEERERIATQAALDWSQDDMQKIAAANEVGVRALQMVFKDGV